MARFFLAILLIFIAVQANNAISPMEVYWHSVLPNTTMPRFIHDLINPMQRNNRVEVLFAFVFHYVVYDQFPSATYIKNNLFLKKAIYPGAQISEGINFNKTVIGNAFVPRIEADAILPFSSNNLPNILHHFSIIQGSKKAKRMEKIIKTCEAPAMEGEIKFCTTSLESMIDNVTSLLGTHDIQIASTTTNGLHEKMAFNIASPIKKLSDDHDRLVICHPLPSPQATHYCHSSFAYEGYIMRLVGKDGSIVNAATVCHHDTINFNRNILDVLNVKPGTEPICHILPEDHFFWVRNRRYSGLASVL